MAEVENIKVAVRVRPFNKREKDRKAKNIVFMSGNATRIENPDDSSDQRNYTYDHSYWSFDGFKENSSGYFGPDPSHPNGKNYCDQKRIYDDLGKGILSNAWKGYNASLFAYGQTGSGKSWSVIGYDSNKGIVPQFCEELFAGIKASTEAKQYEVYFSMLEIYNEVVRDLLISSQKKEGLKIRQHPKKGFYAEGLCKVLVSSNKEIMTKMDQGTEQRTVRATNMNATSSRAHTIVAVTFIQKFKNARGEETAKTSVVNLVDLAGSERVESTGATGKRLKEGAAINLSLTSLGKVIHALVLKTQGDSGVRVPYRDSSLTKLLMNALGGNSKTVMVAAISPADINHDETLSTLKFADRAKEIKTKATVNEDPTEKLIRELKIENEELKKKLQGGSVAAAAAAGKDFVDEDGDGIDDRDAARLRAKWEEEMNARLKENEVSMVNMKKSYEDRLKNAQKEHSTRENEIAKQEEDKQTKPHITNLNQDPQLNQKVHHVVEPKKGDRTTIGKAENSNIFIVGPGIQAKHAEFIVDKKKYSLLSLNDSRVIVNGESINKKTALSHNDRLVFGSTQVWVFKNPQEKPNKNLPDITYEYAQEEIAAKSGINIMGREFSSGTDVNVLQHEIVDVMPAINEANAISEELDRKVKFEVEIIAPEATGDKDKKTQVQVKMINLENGTEYHLAKDKFMDRIFKMREMFNSVEEEVEEEELKYPEEDDPFHESPDTEIQIATAYVSLKPISHKVETKERVMLRNKGFVEIGELEVEIIPCNSSGKEFTDKDDVFVEDSNELIGKNFDFVVKILSMRGFPAKYRNVFCTYNMYFDKNMVKTAVVPDVSKVNFNHKKRFSFKKVTKQFTDYLAHDNLTIKVMGMHLLSGSAVPLYKGLTTKDILKQDPAIFSKTAHLMKDRFQLNGRVVDPQKQSIIVELLLMKKTQAKLQQRCDNVAKLIKEAENTSKLRVSTTLLREVMNASTSEQADGLIRKKLSDESDTFNDGTASCNKSKVCTLL